MGAKINAVIERLRLIPAKVGVAIGRTTQSSDWRLEMVGIAAQALERNNIFAPGMLGALMSLMHHESTTGMMRFWLHSHQAAAADAGHGSHFGINATTAGAVASASKLKSNEQFVLDIPDEDVRRWVMMSPSEGGKRKRDGIDPKDDAGNWDWDKITSNVVFAKRDNPGHWAKSAGKFGSLITEAARMRASEGVADAAAISIPGEVMAEILAEWKAHVRERLPKRVAAAIRKELGSASGDPF